MFSLESMVVSVVGLHFFSACVCIGGNSIEKPSAVAMDFQSVAETLVKKMYRQKDYGGSAAFVSAFVGDGSGSVVMCFALHLLLPEVEAPLALWVSQANGNTEVCSFRQ